MRGEKDLLEVGRPERCASLSPTHIVRDRQGAPARKVRCDFGLHGKGKVLELEK